VTGLYVNAWGERELRPIFQDMMIKANKGWQMFFSYLAPPR
jgi:hypothetical protein